MATRQPQSICGCQIGSVTYAWYVNKAKNPYKSISSQLGIKVNITNGKGLVFGASKPSPAKVRFTMADGTNRLLFCAPDKMGSVVNDNSCKGKSINGIKIVSAGFISR